MTASKIEWTDRSDWNPIRGCTRVSPGCGGPGPHGGCYAEAIAGRFSDPGQAFHGFATRTPKGGRWTGKVALIEERLTLPLRWRRPAPGRNKVFPSSTSDIFHEALSDDDIDRIFAVMALAPDWEFQILTKRSDRMRAYVTAPGRADNVWNAIETLLDAWHDGMPPMRHIRLRAWDGDAMTVALGSQGAVWGGERPWPLRNVWLGVSVEDQPRANQRIPDLLDTPAVIRFISAEPLLGRVDLTALDLTTCLNQFDALRGMTWGRTSPRYGGARLYSGVPRAKLDGVIVGGESGPRARDNDFLENARFLRDQCRVAAVPFFGKQNVRKAPLPADLMVRELPV